MKEGQKKLEILRREIQSALGDLREGRFTTITSDGDLSRLADEIISEAQERDQRVGSLNPLRQGERKSIQRRSDTS
jgi:hypothetical protein